MPATLYPKPNTFLLKFKNNQKNELKDILSQVLNYETIIAQDVGLEPTISELKSDVINHFTSLIDLSLINWLNDKSLYTFQTKGKELFIWIN